MVDATAIKPKMPVVGCDGEPVGTVDRVQGPDRIKLTRTDAQAGGRHHLIPVDWVDHVDDRVHLRKSSRDAMVQWQAAA
jgi:hypothetical protein